MVKKICLVPAAKLTNAFELLLDCGVRARVTVPLDAAVPNSVDVGVKFDV